MFNTLQDFYKSTQWKNCIAVIKAERLNDMGVNICEHCGRPIIKAYDCIGHHKEPLTLMNVNSPEISLNPDNIMLLHHSCHNEIHNRFGLYQRQRVIIVYGSPLSGKTSFVESAKGDRDIVVDLDRLWSAITFEPLYVKNNYLKTNIFEVRNHLLDQIKTRRGQWSTAWIIGSYPKRGERERLAERLGAELIHIDTPKEECLERLAKVTDHRDYSQWEQYIEKYFTELS